MAERHSQADGPVLVADPTEVAQIESENSLRQFDAAMSELQSWLSKKDYKLKPSLILKLHRVLLDRLSLYAGVYRPASVTIGGSRHSPPPADAVPEFVEELCDYVNSNWAHKSAVHLAAYILWRMNWIHPFSDGNGRTARIVSYLVLCAHSGNRLPGDLTIPEQISRQKQPYYDALEEADRAWSKKKIDVSQLEELLAAHLANQLYDFYEKAAGRGAVIGELSKADLDKVLAEARAAGAVDREAIFSEPVRSKRGILAWIEAHPAFTALIAAVMTALVTLVSVFAK